MMRDKEHLGGIIHTYQKYDPVHFPSPTCRRRTWFRRRSSICSSTAIPAGSTEEELARAVHLDPSQIAGLGPSLDALMEMLRERKRRNPRNLRDRHRAAARRRAELPRPGRAHEAAGQAGPAVSTRRCARNSSATWNSSGTPAGDERGKFARNLLQLVERLGEKYQVDELAGKYEFTGRQSMTVPEALEIKAELEKIDELLKQLEEATKTAQIGVIDMEELAQFAEPGDIEQLSALQQQIQDYLREMAEQQGLEQGKGGGFQLTPKAYRPLSVASCWTRNFQQSASVAHRPASGCRSSAKARPRCSRPKATSSAIPSPTWTSPPRWSTPCSAAVRGLPVRLKPEDIEIHRTRNNPKCATAVLLDMCGSMRYDGLYANVKRMGLALDGLIRKEYPGDFLQFVEMYTFAKPRHVSEVAALMPKPVTIFDPWCGSSRT